MDVAEDRPRIALRAPVGEPEQLGAVRDVDGDVPGADLIGRRHLDLGARDLGAERRRLLEGQAAAPATADVGGHAIPMLGIAELTIDQLDQIVDVEEITDLLARAAKPDVVKRTTEVVGEHPVGEHALVDLAHLPRTGDHAATVDDRSQAVRGPVFLDQQFGGLSFVAPYRLRAPARGNASEMPAGEAPGNGCSVPSSNRVSVSPSTSDSRGGDRIDAARREEDDVRAAAPGELEAVVGADQVRTDQIVRAAVVSGEHGRLGGTLDECVDLLDR